MLSRTSPPERDIDSGKGSCGGADTGCVGHEGALMMSVRVLAVLMDESEEGLMADLVALEDAVDGQLARPRCDQMRWVEMRCDEVRRGAVRCGEVR